MTEDSNSIPMTSLAIVPRTFTEVSTIADVLSKSGLLPKALLGKIPDVTMAIMAGAELGLPPVAALRSIHVVDGKTILSADVMVAIVLSRKAAVYFKRISASETEATYETLRTGEKQPQRLTWTWEMAKAAGLNTKDNWRLYKRQMLSARAKAELARDVYPDVLAGCYTLDEVDENGPPTTLPQVDYETGKLKTTGDVIDADFVEAPVSVEQPTTTPAEASLNEIAGALVAAIYATTTLDDLVPLKAEADKLPKKTAARKSAIAALVQQNDKLKLAQLAPVVDQVANDTQPTEAVAS